MNDIPRSKRRSSRGEGVTSASSHPELMSGYLAVPPRSFQLDTSMNHSVSDTPRSSFGVGAIFLIMGLLAIIVFRTTSTQDQVEVHRVAQSCHQWHLAAGTAVSRLVKSTRDADLVQINDAVFRIRRARRNCEAGWVALACQDYHAVAAGIPGQVMNRHLFPCARLAESASHRD
jgi:hypothetical protein